MTIYYKKDNERSKKQTRRLMHYNYRRLVYAIVALFVIIVTPLFADDTSVWLSLDGTQDSITTAKIGELLDVWVIDPYANVNPLALDTVTVTLFSQIPGNDTETLTLLELDINLGIFHINGGGVLLSTTTTETNTNNKILVTKVNDTVAVWYGVRPYEDSIIVQPATTAAEADFIDSFFIPGPALIVETYSIYPGFIPPQQNDTVYVVITDADANEDPYAQDQITITVTNNQTLDSRSFTLIETSDTTGVFYSAATGVILELIDTTYVSTLDNIIACTTVSVNYLTLRYLDPDDNDLTFDTVSVVPEPNSIIVITDGSDTEDSFAIGDTRLFVLVKDYDEDIDGSVDEVSVTVYSNTGDSVIVTIRESMPPFSAGVFHDNLNNGVILTDSGTAQYGDNILLVGNASTYNYITAVYQDNDAANDRVTDTASCYRKNDTGIIEFINAQASMVDTYSIGTNIYIILTEYDENQDPMVAETVYVTIITQRNDSEVFILTENGLASGIFSNTGTLGIFLTDTKGATADSIVFAINNDTIEIRWQDNAVIEDRDTVAVYKVPSDGDIYIYDNFQTLSDTARPGDTILILIRDNDKNLDPSSQDLAGTVTIYSKLNGVVIDSIVLLSVLESGNATGEFTQEITLSDTTSGETTLLVGYNFVVEAIYTDSVYSTDTGIDSIVIKLRYTSSSGIFTVDTQASMAVDSYAIYDSIYILGTDYNRNINPLSKDTIVVTLSTNCGDTEILVLTETTDTSGMFINLLPVYIYDTLLVVGDNILTAGYGDTITVNYIDIYDASDSATGSVIVRRINRSSNITLINSLGQDTDHYYVNSSSVYVILTDYDANVNPESRDTVVVTLFTFNGSQYIDTEIIVLTEILSSTGAFTSSQTITLSSSQSGTGILLCGNSDSVVVKYEDIGSSITDTVYDTAIAIYVPVVSNLTILDKTGIVPTNIFIGDTFTIILTDLDENKNPLAIDTVLITIAVYPTLTSRSDTVYLQLSETTESGVFRGFFESPLYTSDTFYGQGTSDSVLFIDSGEQLAVIYNDNDDSTDSRIDISIFMKTRTTTALLKIVNSSGVDTDLFFIGDSLYIYLTDADRNWDKKAKDTVIVTLHSVTTNDTEYIVLTESSDTSGIFTNVNYPGLALRKTASLVLYDNILAVSTLDTGSRALQLLYTDTQIEYQYDTANITDIQVTATLVLLDSLFQAADTFYTTGELYATLTDLDADVNPVIRDTVVVTLLIIETNDSELLVLTEINSNIGIFSDTTSGLSFALKGAGGVSRNNVLQPDTSGTIVGYCNDAYDTAYFIDNASTAVIVLVNKNGYAVSEYICGIDSVYIILTDLDANQNRLSIETVVVTVTHKYNDTEIIALTELWADSGVFSNLGTAGLPISAVNGMVMNDGILYVQALRVNRDEIIVIYLESSGAGTQNPIRPTVTPGLPVVTDFSKTIVGPNPFRGDVNATITFQDIPDQFTIRIYTISGKLVYEYTGTTQALNTPGRFVWDVINGAGESVRSGIYVYYIESPGIGKKTGKIAIIR
ncbi:MAG: hypothetical protein AB1765_03685 [Candidatus Hydrogenedentota bacterium]